MSDPDRSGSDSGGADPERDRAEGPPGAPPAAGPAEPPDPRGEVDPASGPDAAVPEWDDEYLDRVADRLQFNYDLARDCRIGGESFTLYGRLEMDSHKQFLHPAISYGHQHSTEHLFARRAESVRVEEIDRLAALAHDLADRWIDADEEHFSTEFVFALVVPEIPAAVRERVEGHADRTMLKYGYHGHYETGFVVAAPDREELAESGVGVADAFRLWEDGGEEKGVLARLRGLLG